MKNKLFYLLLVLGLVLFSGLTFCFDEVENKEINDSYVKISTDMGEFDIPVMFAKNESEWEKGLMFKTNLGKYKGMLFIFDEENIQNMWMKNTYLPLDMVFFDKMGRVVNVEKDAVPESLSIISSIFPAKYVLELIGGEAKKYGFNRKSKILLINDENKLLHF